MKKLEPFIVETLKKYGFGEESLWDCHGTPVVYHKVLEQIAAKAGIVFQSPFVAEAATKDKCAAIIVTGELKDRIEWSVGEAAPYNNKNSYPWAMAEKRAKDRVILKLIGLHGFVYSEDEADDFKESRPPQKPSDTFHGPLGITELRKQLREFAGDLLACEEPDQVTGLVFNSEALIQQCRDDLEDDWEEKMDEAIEKATERCAK